MKAAAALAAVLSAALAAQPLRAASREEIQAWVLDLRDGRLSAEAEDKLVRAGEDSVEALLEQALDVRREHRMTKILLRIGSEAVPRLLGLLEHPRLGSKAGAMLFRVIDARSAGQAERLIACVRSLPRSRQYCGMALVKSMSPKAGRHVPLLAGALGDPEPALRAYAAGALGQIGPRARSAAAELIRALKDPEAGVRLAAAAALGKIGPRSAQAAPALEAALEDPDGEVRQAARSALEALRG